MPLTYELASKIAKDFGFSCTNQVGSHTQWKKLSDKDKITIPHMKELAIGTGRVIIKKIAIISGVSFEHIVKKYKIKF